MARRYANANRRDANEPEVIRPIEDSRFGVLVQLHEGDGADWMWLVAGSVIFLEIKNPAYAWHYTDDEMNMMAVCEATDVEYRTLETAEDTLKLLKEVRNE